YCDALGCFSSTVTDAHLVFFDPSGYLTITGISFFPTATFSPGFTEIQPSLYAKHQVITP
ncbi:hypothetical protein, partial [Staphylococcus pseudintermedius]|uniref:hypothetical protein n=1 Tax=Staphylococcus pseudintermedius TaxID=283734 RepID=UPI001C9301DF